MGLHVSFQDAVARGWIEPADTPKPCLKTSGRAVAREPGKGRSSWRAAPIDPQGLLFDALVVRLGEDAVRSEVDGLVPGRRYRADIYLPESRLVVEFDGFQFHRSKDAFQKDRERQNLFVLHGYRVLRYVNKQVTSDLDAVIAEIERAHRGAGPQIA